jgi:hypothetical protein
VSEDWAREQIAIHGRDNAWVKAYILGEFPSGSINALLTVDEIEAAMDRELKKDEYSYSQKRLGIDVARFGDDRTVIFPRQGLAALNPVVMRHQDVFPIAARAKQAYDKWGAEHVFIDGTGGWGVGVSASMRDAGVPVIEVQFAGRPTDPRYLNMRAQMWFRMAEWAKKGGSIPYIPEMIKELTGATYSFSNGKFALEPKDLIKKRCGVSPDLADALALTFAWDDSPSNKLGIIPGILSNAVNNDFDPYDDKYQ